MLTPDDQSHDGRTHPELFPARNTVIHFCHDLRKERDVQLLHQLPRVGDGSYVIGLHQPDGHYNCQGMGSYFNGLVTEGCCVYFLDPDNGFEPETTSNEKHVSYSDVANIHTLMSSDSVISVFQHFRRIPFVNDFSRIKQRLSHDFVAAIYWHSLMFITIAKSEETFRRIIIANNQYSQIYPVKVLI